jgi:hypothetical protein
VLLPRPSSSRITKDLLGVKSEAATGLMRAPAGGVAENRRSFKHLHHEGALAQHDFVAGTDSGEHSVHDRQPEEEEEEEVTMHA